MNDVFDEREKGFEAKYKLDQELAFKVNVRRDKLFGLWVAQQLRLQDDAADAYARTAVEAGLEKPGDDDILAKVRADLTNMGMIVPEEALRRRLDVLGETARNQVMTELTDGRVKRHA